MIFAISINCLQSWMFRSKLSFSVSKCAYLKLKGCLKFDFDFRLGESVICQVESYRYLGIVVSKNLKFKKHTDYVYSTCIRKLHCLKATLRLNKCLSFASSLLIYNQVVVPSIAYGSSFWFSSDCRYTVRRLVTLQRVCLLAVTCCFKTTSIEALNVIAGVPPIIDVITRRSVLESLCFCDTVSFGRLSIFRNAGLFAIFCEEQFLGNFPRSAINSVTSLELLSGWNRSWVVSVKDVLTHRFFPSIYSRLKMKHFITRGPLPQFLSGHCYNSFYLFRFGFLSSPSCGCGGAVQDVCHDLLSCPLLDDLRCFRPTSFLDALLPCNLKLFKRFVASLNALHRVDIPFRYPSVSPRVFIRP